MNERIDKIIKKADTTGDVYKTAKKIQITLLYDLNQHVPLNRIIERIEEND